MLKISRGGEQLKVSEVAGLIDQIQAGGGEEELVFASNTKLMDIINSSLTGIFKVTNEKAPGGVDTTDISVLGDGSVVAWKQDNNLTVSSQSNKKVHFNDLSYLGCYSEYLGSSIWNCILPFNEILYDNLSIKYTRSFGNFFYNGNKLKTIDISNLKFNFLPFISDYYDKDQGSNTQSIPYFWYMFNGCNQLTTIYCNPIENIMESTADVFKNCSSLPNWNNSNTKIDMCKFKEDGGYFTNPAEKGN